MQDADPGGVAEYLKQIGQTVQVVLADDVFRVDMVMMMYLAYGRGIIEGGLWYQGLHLLKGVSCYCL